MEFFPTDKPCPKKNGCLDVFSSASEVRPPESRSRAAAGAKEAAPSVRLESGFSCLEREFLGILGFWGFLFNLFFLVWDFALASLFLESKNGKT